jgi:hypothetical protein
MSNDRAIAAVTATLRAMIFRAVSTEPGLGGSQVTARPPDRARLGATGNLINLFLYRTSIDAAWRNQSAAWQRPGEEWQPPLPLILSYLVTAYGENDDEVLSHRLLGAAMRVLHSQPLLSPTDIATALPGSELEVQVERVRITPHPIPLDEVSRMWATFQTGYRISVSYDAAVVLIDQTMPARAARPVLKVGANDTGPTVIPQLRPVLAGASAPGGLPAARPGEPVTLAGSFLGGVTQVRFSGLRLAVPVTIAVTTATPDAALVTLPTAPALPAGSAAAVAITAAEAGTLVSNEIPVALAPTITGKLPLAARLANDAATVALDCAPPVEAGQAIALIVGEQVVLGTPGEPGTPARTHLEFSLTGFAPGTYPVRLRVDGIDSIPLAPGNLTVFDPSQSLELT